MRVFKAGPRRRTWLISVLPEWAQGLLRFGGGCYAHCLHYRVSRAQILGKDAGRSLKCPLAPHLPQVVVKIINSLGFGGNLHDDCVSKYVHCDSGRLGHVGCFRAQ